MTLLDAVILRRADEQMAGAWRRPPLREARAEKRELVPKLCEVVGCDNEIVGRHPRAHVCAECAAKGLVPSPCPGCGGPRRRTDQKHAGRNRAHVGLCQTCRTGLTPAERSAA